MTGDVDGFDFGVGYIDAGRIDVLIEFATTLLGYLR